LIVNVGTPRSPAVADVRHYLREFLSDPDVIQINRALWWPILHGIVLPFRSPKSARLYARIWSAEGSPLLVNSLKQRERLAAELGPSFRVALGMRYGTPSLSEAIDELLREGCDPIVAAPMFPQYSTATSGSVDRAIEHEIAVRPRASRLVRLAPWHANPGYIAALAARIHDVAADQRIDHHVMSFHGVPASYIARGDPYRDRCVTTAGMLARELGLPDDHWSMVFQSRFGRQEWLQPYANEYVPALASRHRRVLVTTPGFVADCLETLEEIHLRLREQFLSAGGEELVVVPALNDHPLWIRSLAALIRSALGTADAPLPTRADSAVGGPATERPT
jgi:ferrochelatase